MLWRPFMALAARPPLISGTVSSPSCITGCRGCRCPCDSWWCTPMDMGRLSTLFITCASTSGWVTVADALIYRSRPHCSFWDLSEEVL